MKQVIIDGKVVATFKTAQPHGELREIMINAMLEGKKVEVRKI